MGQDDQIERFRAFVSREAGRGMSRREFLRRGLALGLSLPSVLSVLAGCGIEPPQTPQAAAPTTLPPTPLLSGQAQPAGTAEPVVPAPTVAPTPTVVPTPTRFAVIGDFGMAGDHEQAVAELVKSWNPDFIVTTGDNNYPNGTAETIDANIGQYYHEFIAPYKGSYGPGASTNRFFPVLGNHDWVVGYPKPYLDYFTLPDPQRYYAFSWGPAHFFMLDSMLDEPDGVRSDSVQAAWLQRELAAATARWKIIVFHHPSFSSGHHGSSGWMQWPFHEWGANLVLNGHDHNYERLIVGGLPYIVNGLGGGARYAPGAETVAGSQIFFNTDHGAMLVEMDQERLALQFVTQAGQVIDSHSIQ